ncbi:MAG TPA: hypothetical protein VIU93_12055 [Gallionellaceae bacterium]
MLIPDMPDVPDQYLPIIVAENKLVSSSLVGKEGTIGVCEPIPNVPGMDIGDGYSLSVPAAVINYLWKFDVDLKQMSEEERWAKLTSLESKAKVTVIQKPDIGALNTELIPGFASPNYLYKPTLNKSGKSQAIFFVEMGEYRFKVIYELYSVAGDPGPETMSKICGKRGQYYKVSGSVD